MKNNGRLMMIVCGGEHWTVGKMKAGPPEKMTTVGRSPSAFVGREEPWLRSNETRGHDELIA